MNVYAEGFKLKVCVGTDGTVKDGLEICNDSGADIVDGHMTVKDLTGGNLECGGSEGLWRGIITRCEVLAECMEYRLLLILSAIAATTGMASVMEAAGYYGLTTRDILKAVAPRAL